MKRIAVICCTPYHLFVLVFLQKEVWKNEIIDVYIQNTFEQAGRLAIKFKHLNLFNNVILVEDEIYYDFDKMPRIMYLVKRLFNCIRSEKYLKNHINCEIPCYNEIWYSGRNQFTDYFIKHFYKEDKSLKVILFEDGVSTYSGYSKNISSSKKLLLRLAGIPKQAFEIETMWVFNKMACGNMLGETQILEIPKTRFEETKLLLQNIFDYNNSYHERYIFFEQFLDAEKDLFNMIVNNIKYEELILKTHPRKTTKLYGNTKQIKEKNVPWEVICLNQSYSKQCLISLGSTAMCAPKFLFDEEPYLLFLYELAEKEERKKALYDRFAYIGKLMKEIYQNKDRVLIPKTKEDVIRALDVIDRGLGAAIKGKRR